jgi:hypothetical protein
MATVPQLAAAAAAVAQGPTYLGAPAPSHVQHVVPAFNVRFTACDGFETVSRGSLFEAFTAC